MENVKYDSTDYWKFKLVTLAHAIEPWPVLLLREGVRRECTIKQIMDITFLDNDKLSMKKKFDELKVILRET